LISIAGQIDASQTPIKGGPDFIARAIAEGKNQIEATPKDARAYVILGSLYYGIGQYPQAITYLEQAQKLSPQKQTILFELGASYIGIKQPEKAIAYFKQAYELAPQFMDSRITYAAAAIYAGKDSIATELLKEVPSNDIILSDKILQAYVASGQKQKVIDIWKSRVVLNPTDAQNYISLAVSYLYVKDNKNAIAAIQKAIEIQPLFKEQGEAIIKDIRAGKDVLNPQ
jgi:tetratricopeptide (TPR) repeat protein